ncbi:hypothetical protein ACX27_26795 [Nostoc piscinale CENA21]|uniref:Uncharacterized protein n=1 Tax=Nostoc piscinale CENA21 TaxID=224013 RepID=A0A0M3V6L2_9NOSO|nr:hypothetical protein [Nostoc piscinale]ALF55637.1 hypothetical protein ACX27_26795 [Nostoc piscinale CENA21]
MIAQTTDFQQQTTAITTRLKEIEQHLFKLVTSPVSIAPSQRIRLPRNHRLEAAATTLSNLESSIKDETETLQSIRCGAGTGVLSYFRQIQKIRTQICTAVLGEATAERILTKQANDALQGVCKELLARCGWLGIILENAELGLTPQHEDWQPYLQAKQEAFPPLNQPVELFGDYVAIAGEQQYKISDILLQNVNIITNFIVLAEDAEATGSLTGKLATLKPQLAENVKVITNILNFLQSIDYPTTPPAQPPAPPVEQETTITTEETVEVTLEPETEQQEEPAPHPVEPTSDGETKVEELFIFKLEKPARSANSSRKYYGDGFLHPSYISTESVAKYINSLLEPLSPNYDSYRFFLHILACTDEYRYANDDCFVPACRNFIEDKVPGARGGKNTLIAAGLIECDGQYIVGTKSLKYRVKPEILETVAELTIADLESDNVERYDLCKQKRRPDAPRSIYTLNGKAISPDHHRHIATNSSATVEITQERKRQMFAELRTLRTNYKSMPSLTEEQKVLKLRAKHIFLSTFAAYKALVLESGAVSLPNGKILIKPAYSPQKSGRITMNGGGLQNLPRHFQDILFHSTQYHNIDMQAAQSRIALQLLKEDGLSSAWLEEYTTNPKAKYVHAAACFPDVAEDVRTGYFKDLLHSYLMGATIAPPSDKLKAQWVKSWQAKYVDGKAIGTSAARDVVFAMYTSAEQAYAAYVRWYNHCLPLITDIGAWHKLIELAIAGKAPAPAWLVRNAVKKSTLHKHLGKPSVRNKMGATEDLDGLKGGELIRSLVYFLLQGAEAAYITAAEALLEEYNIKLAANMHDGFICKVEGSSNLESILDEISRRASEISGVGGTLVEKKWNEPQPEDTVTVTNVAPAQTTTTPVAKPIPVKQAPPVLQPIKSAFRTVQELAAWFESRSLKFAT